MSLFFLGLVLLQGPTALAQEKGPETKIYIGGIGIDVGGVVHPLCPLDGKPFVPAPGSPYRKVKAAALSKGRAEIRTITMGYSLSAWDPSGRPLLLSQEDEAAHFLISTNGEVIQVADPAEPGGPVSRAITINLQAEANWTGAGGGDRVDGGGDGGTGPGTDRVAGGEPAGALSEPEFVHVPPEAQVNSLRALLRGVAAALPALRGGEPRFSGGGVGGASGASQGQGKEKGEPGKGQPRIRVVGLKESQALSDLIKDALNPKEVLHP